MYEWLFDEIIATGLKTYFTHYLTNQLTSIVIYDKNNYSTVIFKDADSFYSWLMLVEIFSIPRDIDFITNNYIYLVNNNPKSTRNFFNNLIETKFKYNTDAKDDDSKNKQITFLLHLITNAYKGGDNHIQHIYTKK